MASGEARKERLRKHRAKQEENQEYRKSNKIPELKRTKKGLRKYGKVLLYKRERNKQAKEALQASSSPITTRTRGPITYRNNTLTDQSINELKRNISFIRYCFDRWEASPEAHRKIVRDEIIEAKETAGKCAEDIQPILQEHLISRLDRMRWLLAGSRTKEAREYFPFVEEGFRHCRVMSEIREEEFRLRDFLRPGGGKEEFKKRNADRRTVGRTHF